MLFPEEEKVLIKHNRLTNKYERKKLLKELAEKVGMKLG